MKKSLLIAGLACVALAACTKNEVVSVAPDQEITFQTLSTKADPTVGFNINNVFYSYAYYLAPGLSWDSSAESATEYIRNSTISFDSGRGVWKNADNTYYWPKQGSLTFFAWTDNTTSPEIQGSGASVSCNKTTGIQFTDYSVKDNQNRDLMVAKIAAGKTANDGTGHTDPENSRTWASGVPTDFKRVLSKVVFNVVTEEDYSSDVTIKVKSIKLKNVKHKGTYTQPLASTADPRQLSAWANESDQTELPVYTNASGFTVTKTSQNLDPAPSDYYIVLPQTLEAGMQLELVYEYTTNYGVSFTQTFTESPELTGIYTASWEPGKKYTLNITFRLNEILWDPTVEDWDTGTTQDITL
ncbi:MAG: fimbrillin family protein [Bacteroidales bacterium]|nr:fimbrillin family protein [Bacteroidales bacterium]